jgi:hypothetical protein
MPTFSPTIAFCAITATCALFFFVNIVNFVKLGVLERPFVQSIPVTEMLRPATPAENRKRCCCKVPRVTEVLADVDCDVKLLLMTAPALCRESREYGLVTLSAHFGVSKRPTTKN